MTRLMIVHVESKRIKRLSTTKNIKPSKGFIKPTALVTFIIFLLCSIKFCLSQYILHRPILPSLHVLLSLTSLSLQIKYIFLKFVDILQDLLEALVEISSFCFETFLQRLLFHIKALKRQLNLYCNIKYY